MLPKPLKHIPGIAPYVPGRPIEEVQRQYGLDSVIKLASNENPLGPSPLAVKAMMNVVKEMHLYPDGDGYFLKQAISRRCKVPMDSIILSNGSDEITDMLAIAFLSSSDNVIVSQHDFVSYKLAAQMVRAGIREVPLKNWRCDLPAILKAIDDKTRLICIANPSNPIGSMVTKEELEPFLEKVPGHVLVLLDEAYSEYVTARSYPNGTKYLKKNPNLVVTRTFSKAYGLAGLRIGYGFAHPDVIQNLDRVRAPFNANRMAQAAALAALDDVAHLRRSVENNKKEMKRLETAFEQLGLAYVPSATNFILVEVKRPGGAVTESLLKQGVIVRPVGGYGLPHHVRVTVGTPSENRRFLAAFKKTLKEVDPLA